MQRNGARAKTQSGATVCPEMSSTPLDQSASRESVEELSATWKKIKGRASIEAIAPSSELPHQPQAHGQRPR